VRAVDVIRRKRHGAELDRQELAFLVTGMLDGTIPDYQITAFLMAVALLGMSEQETMGLTEEMLHSGSVLDLSDIQGQKVDKHSTGGVGDKTSLVIAPLAAAAGVIVPMISGRGLGHTGGTLDKLESIPGFSVRLGLSEFREVLAKAGCALIGQTDEIAPADRKLYALRDVTGTVESIPLIVASILSKKLAEGIEGLVLDVKVGSGAFMKDLNSATELGTLLASIAHRLGTRSVAIVSDMNQPLGTHVGNALEVKESVEVLRGGGPEDLRELCLLLTAHMLVFGRVAGSVQEGTEKAATMMASGADVFRSHSSPGGGSACRRGSRKTAPREPPQRCRQPADRIRGSDRHRGRRCGGDVVGRGPRDCGCPDRSGGGACRETEDRRSRIGGRPSVDASLQ
jgi:pyrimidine-nucleoside phosphorylase